MRPGSCGTPRRTAALACLATIAVADYAILRRRPRWLVIGLFDEPAHVATAALVLLNARRTGRAAAVAFLAGSVLIDADHVPLALAEEHPGPDDPRPTTHTLLVPLALAALGRRAFAAGVWAHFARDLALGPGVPLLWPLSRRDLRLPHGAYLAACAVLAVRASRAGERATLTAGP